MDIAPTPDSTIAVDQILRALGLVENAQPGAEQATILIATVKRLAPPGSTYARVVDEIVEANGYNYKAHVEVASGVLAALRRDYEDGYLRSVVEIAHASLFADFLEMARHLLDAGFKDPAAVIAGTALEAHLRQLAGLNGLATEDVGGKPATAERLNIDLRQASVYEVGDQKAVTAWLDLRNDAAHGRWDNYEAPQVNLLIENVRDFMRRHPA